MKQIHLFRTEKQEESFSSLATEQKCLNNFLLFFHHFPRIPTSHYVHFWSHDKAKPLPEPPCSLPKQCILKKGWVCFFVVFGWLVWGVFVFVLFCLGVIPVCFCFLKPDECTESFLSSSLVKHLSLTFARVTQAHQDRAAVHSHLPLSNCFSPQTSSWASKCAKAF